MARENRTEYAILGLLRVGPRSGYDIKKVVEEHLSHFWHESLSHIYPVLHRLHDRGWVDREEGVRGGRQRHEYSLTRDGRDALEAWLAEPPEPQPPRNELLLKLFLGRHADPGDLIRHVREYRDRRRAELEELEGIAARLEEDATAAPDYPYWRITVSAGIRSARAAVDWSDEALEILGEVES